MNKKNMYILSHWKEIYDLIFNILKNYPDGLKEYELIEELKIREILPEETLSGNLNLFQTHFILFHTLYKLKNEIEKNNEQTIEISALRIRILPYTAAEKSLQSPDSLRDYYLNLDNLHNTKEEDVKDLLNQFWERFVSSQEKEDALSLLGLKEPVTFQNIKDEYRKLVKRHHPDRGGDCCRFQKISLAMETLNRYYGKK